MDTTTAILLAYLYGQAGTIASTLTIVAFATAFAWAGVSFVQEGEARHKRWLAATLLATTLAAAAPSKETVGIAILAGGGVELVEAIRSNEDIKRLTSKAVNVLETKLDAAAEKK